MGGQEASILDLIEVYKHGYDVILSRKHGLESLLICSIVDRGAQQYSLEFSGIATYEYVKV